MTDDGDREMLVTVAIPTLNRAEALHHTLESLAATRVPDGVDWEIVIVNNNCTDNTDEIIEAFVGQLPVRRVFEPQRGHSPARNRAVEAAKGHYIVWTDDDVIVDPGRLGAYVEAFRRWPEAAVFGGPILPRYAVPVPKWIIDNEARLHGVFGIRDLGDQPVPLSETGYNVPYGANFAVRCTEQRNFLYNPDLGYGPVQRRVGEETDVIARILRNGAIGYWVPKARVEHCIRPDMQTVRHVMSHFVALGEADAYLFHRRQEEEQHEVPLWFGAPRWMWRQMVEEWFRYRIHRVISPAGIWLPHLHRYAHLWGRIRYCRSDRP